MKSRPPLMEPPTVHFLPSASLSLPVRSIRPPDPSSLLTQKPSLSHAFSLSLARRSPSRRSPSVQRPGTRSSATHPPHEALLCSRRAHSVRRSSAIRGASPELTPHRPNASPVLRRPSSTRSRSTPTGPSAPNVVPRPTTTKSLRSPKVEDNPEIFIF